MGRPKEKPQTIKVKACLREIGPEDFETEQQVAQTLLSALEKFGSVYNLNKCDGELVHSWILLRRFVQQRTPKAVASQLEDTRRVTLGSLFSKTTNPKGEER